MDEAERLADRVAIMDHGAILVEGPPADLINQWAGEHTIEFEATVSLPIEELEGLPSVQRVVANGPSRFLTVNESHRAVPALMQLLTSRGAELASLNTHRATLDDVFLTLTGRQMRDE
jgi:ABC-2 type transport system ATP-binding protein